MRLTQLPSHPRRLLLSSKSVLKQRGVVEGRKPARGQGVWASPHSCVTTPLKQTDSGRPECTQIQFNVVKEVAIGEELVVVGNLPQLGNWTAAKGAKLTWGAGHVWSGVVEVPSGTKLSYKFAKVVNGRKGATEWEAGEDRTLPVHELACPAVTVTAGWCQGACIEATFSPESSYEDGMAAFEQHEQEAPAEAEPIETVATDPIAAGAGDAGSTDAAAAGAECYTLCIAIQKQLMMGQHFKLVGSDERLGAWNFCDAPQFVWTPDHVWQLSVDLPTAAPVEFKIVQACEGNAGWCLWQDGENTIIDPTELRLHAGATLEVGCTWDGASRAHVTAPAAAPAGAPVAPLEAAADGVAEVDAAEVMVEEQPVGEEAAGEAAMSLAAPATPPAAPGPATNKLPFAVIQELIFAPMEGWQKMQEKRSEAARAAKGRAAEAALTAASLDATARLAVPQPPRITESDEALDAMAAVVAPAVEPEHHSGTAAEGVGSVHAEDVQALATEANLAAPVPDAITVPAVMTASRDVVAAGDGAAVAGAAGAAAVPTASRDTMELGDGGASAGVEATEVEAAAVLAGTPLDAAVAAVAVVPPAEAVTADVQVAADEEVPEADVVAAMVAEVVAAEEVEEAVEVAAELAEAKLESVAVEDELSEEDAELMRAAEAIADRLKRGDAGVEEVVFTPEQLVLLTRAAGLGEAGALAVEDVAMEAGTIILKKGRLDIDSDGSTVVVRGGHFHDSETGTVSVMSPAANGPDGLLVDDSGKLLEGEVAAKAPAGVLGKVGTVAGMAAAGLGAATLMGGLAVDIESVALIAGLYGVVSAVGSSRSDAIRGKGAAGPVFSVLLTAADIAKKIKGEPAKAKAKPQLGKYAKSTVANQSVARVGGQPAAAAAPAPAVEPVHARVQEMRVALGANGMAALEAGVAQVMRSDVERILQALDSSMCDEAKVKHLVEMLLTERPAVWHDEAAAALEIRAAIILADEHVEQPAAGVDNVPHAPAVLLAALALSAVDDFSKRRQ